MAMSDEAESVEPSEAPIRTLEAAEEILRGRELDRILGYIRLKMDVALAANAELSSTRTQIVQMGSFLIVALVIGTGGVQVILGWDIQPIVISAFSALLVAMVVLSVTRTSATYTDIVMDEFLALETVYSLIVWENVDNPEALAKEIVSIEHSTRERIDAQNRKHRLLAGTILHSMIHYERPSPFPDDIGASRHELPFTHADGHRDD
jgi:hypothetical protein